MLRLPGKRGNRNAAIAEERHRRDSLSSDARQPTPKSRVECLLDEKIRQRSQTWCRACLSEHCCLDHTRQVKAPAEPSDEDEAFRQKLDAFKQRRIALENYTGQLEKLSAMCHLGMLRQPYLPSQSQLPPWLIGVIEQDLSLPLVPTFPTSEEALLDLVSGLNLGRHDHELFHDYQTASSCVRRIRVGIAYTGSLKYNPLSISTLPVLFVCEETSDAKVKDGIDSLIDADNESGTLSDFSDQPDEYPSVTQITGRGEPAFQNGPKSCRNMRITEESSKTQERVRVRKAEKFGLNLNPLQLVEKHLEWSSLYVCYNASVSECRDERVMITGRFPTCGFGELPFSLLLFPGERTGVASMRMKGTFIRNAEQSKYKMRWKYDISIPATPLDD